MGPEERWRPTGRDVVGGCFVAFARGEAGPGNPGDRAWVAAVSWRAGPARAGTVLGSVVHHDRVPSSYRPGLLALREGPVLGAALSALRPVPDVTLVDATGRDHPRGAGLALHLGAVLDRPTIGVTHRGLGQERPPVLARRGQVEPVERGGRLVAAWVCTRSGARPLLVHPAWRTDLEVAVAVVLGASNEDARTPRPLQEARRLARQARNEGQDG